jgi:hypothetical protein
MAKKNTTPPTKSPTDKKPQASPTAAVSKAAASQTITHEMISKRAYEIWISKGRPAGRDTENWQQAERELKAAQQKK